MTLARTPYARLSPADIGQVDRELKKLEQMSAGLFVPKVLVAARSPYPVLATDTMLLCDCTAGAITLTFPLAARVDGMSVVVVKSDTTANAITLSGTFAGAVNPQITVPLTGHTVSAMNGVYHVTASVTYPVLAGETGVTNMLHPYGHLRRHGAVSGGNADTAFANAVLSIATLRIGALASVGVSGAMRVIIPQDSYSITQPVVCQPYLGFEVEGQAVIEVAPGIDAFTNISYSNWFRGITVVGGRRHFSLATANADTTMIRIDRCQSIDFTGDAIYSDTTSNSTKCVVREHKFSTASLTARAVNWQTGDSLVIEDPWVSMGPTAEVFRFAGSFAVVLTKMMGVPLTSTGSWIRNEGCIVRASKNRFGGEAGGRTILKNYASADLSAPVVPLSVEFTQNDMYVPAGSNAFEFYDLPNRIKIRDNQGLSDVAYVYFDAAIPEAQIKQIGGQIDIDIDAVKFGGDLVPYRYANPAVIDASRSVLAARARRSRMLTIADVKLQIPITTAGFGVAVASSGVTLTTDTTPLGQTRAIWTATANDASTVQEYATALNGMASGVYTAVFHVETTMPTMPFFLVADLQVPIELTPGRHIVCVPFYYDSVNNAQNLGISLFRMANGQVFRWALTRLFVDAVDVDTEETVVYDTAAPTAGQWFVGDTVLLKPVASGNRGVLCTTAGTPGTWKTYGPIAP